MKKIKLPICLLMALLMSFGACTPADPSTNVKPDYKLWSAPATEKIMQETTFDYSAIEQLPAINIDSAKGEYESAQIILTAKNTVSEYTVELSDLTHSDGETLYAKENIELFTMMYVNVPVAYNTGANIGMYPDGVLPYANSLEYDQNNVKEGCNQSIWFSFNTPMDQKTGIYTGTAKIIVDGESNDVPVSVRIRDLEVSSKVHSKSIFLNQWQFYIGEYEGTERMLDLYNKALIEYRLAPDQVSMDFTYDEAGAKYYADKAYDLAKDERCSNYSIPLSWNTNTGVSVPKFKIFVKALVEKSLETNFNLLEKAVCYFIDEPYATIGYDPLKVCSETFEKGKEESALETEANVEKYLSEYPNVTEEFIRAIIDSIRGVRNIITTPYHEEMDEYIDVYCPYFSDYDIPSQYEQFMQDDERWWYGCTSPKAPYTSYHIDNTLLSARVLGWLQSTYDVVGNLYWATCYYVQRRDYKSMFPNDYYEEDTRFGGAPGEGALFYPGAKFGVDGPIHTIRLHAIRDGLEEYELMYAIKEYYEQVSEQIGLELSAQKLLENITEELHYGLKISANTQNFAVARKALLDVAEFTKLGVLFSDFYEDGLGKVSYTVYIPDGVTLNVKNATLASEKTVAGGKLALYEVDLLTTDANSVVFSTVVNDVAYEFTRPLYSNITLYTPNVLATSFIEGVDSVALSDSGDKLILNLPQASETSAINLKFVNNDVLGDIENIQKINFKFNLDDDSSEIEVKLYVKYANKAYPQEISTIVLRPGDNVFTWNNVNKTDWSAFGNPEYIVFKVGMAGDAARSINLKGISVFKEA